MRRSDRTPNAAGFGLLALITLITSMVAVGCGSKTKNTPAPPTTVVTAETVPAATSPDTTAAAAPSDSVAAPPESAPPASGATSIAAGGGGTAGGGTAVAIKDFAFAPDPIVIKAGGSVTWTNGDKFAHAIQSANGKFNSPKLENAKSFTATFTTPGSYPYICGIHNSMTGTVTVQ